MRVILITSKLNFVTAGGSVADLHLKAKGLVELGHDITVITAFSRANNIDQTLPYKVIEENITSGRLLDIQYGAYKILKKYAPKADAFYIDGHIFLYGGGIFRIFGGKKPIIAFFNIRLNCWGDTQGNETNPSFLKLIKKKIRYWIEKIIGVPIANKLDAFIFNTPMVENLYVKWGFNKDKSHIIEDFVDTTTISASAKSSSELSTHHSIIKPIIFFTSGRMIAEKGFDLIIKAFSKLENKDNYKLIMSGNGPEYDRLAQLTKDLGLEKYISLPGWVEKQELKKFFQNAHIFIFPKWWLEYGSAVLTEAMAYGLPSIIPAGGALEWLSAGASLSFANDSVDNLYKQMERLGTDSNLRISLAEGSHQRTTELNCKTLTKKLENSIQAITVSLNNKH